MALSYGLKQEIFLLFHQILGEKQVDHRELGEWSPMKYLTNRRSSRRGQKKPIKLKRQSFKVKCHYCGGTGHNQKGCDKKKEDGQNQPQKKLTVSKEKDHFNSHIAKSGVYICKYHSS
ncbi:UNVERIFIED_CONTAM: hypothetical protein Sangu_0232100 [Sesamum angustifolium]|uniref:CCHC-type domain-containing protein n=1 Tax=Sesamum angustifolium TaxID=2727405 RepID=A0AAW2RQI6_9LAMI